MLRRITSWFAIIAVTVFLSGCDTAEERAQKHFEKGSSLLAEGDFDRAIIEFRNVFKLDETHKGARLAFAQVLEGRGDTQGAYGQYLVLVEQYPENLDGRRALARLAADLNNWEEAERHITIAESLAPEDPVVQSVRAGLDYRNALRDKNPETAALVVKVAENLLQDNPDLRAARRVVIDDLLRRQDWDNALAALDAGLAVSEDRGLYMLRLGVLEKMGLDAEIIKQIKEMATRFPDEGLHRTLVSQYIARDQLSEAEAYLRERAAQVEEGNPDPQLELIAFLAQRVSPAAAIAEIDRILAGAPDNQALYRSLKAGLDFDAGNRDAAIVEMEDILEGLEPSEEADRIKVALAQMLISTGNSVGARARVEEVLEHDSSQVTALKLKAGWLIEDDKPGDALVELRSALDQAPRDSTIMTAMAQAHERAGNRDLMGEMLALAVEASGSAPTETLHYAQFLIQDAKFLPAEDILLAALRLQNTNPALLSGLGNLYIRMEDWPRAQHVIESLQRLEAEQGRAIANELTARMLAARNQSQELETFLSGLAEGSSGLQAAASIIRLRLAQGDAEGALAYADELIEKNPGDPTLQFIRAGALIAGGQLDEPITILKKILAEEPKAEQAWLTLYRVYRSQGALAEATQVLADARAVLPDSANLKWAAAGEAESGGDIDGAIAIYEDLYATNNRSLVIANNLASLVSSYREDEEGLQRAFNIARRLRGTTVPAFQDTYGWIAHRLGNHKEALEYLEPAAKGLPSDPSVKYHLAEVYVALGQDAEALEQYTKVVEMAADTQPRPPFMDKVEAEVERLSQEKE